MSGVGVVPVVPAAPGVRPGCVVKSGACDRGRVCGLDVAVSHIAEIIRTFGADMAGGPRQFVLQARSVVFAEVMTTVIDADTGDVIGTFPVPIGEPQSVDAGNYLLRFSAPDGYFVTPPVRPVHVRCGDHTTIRVNFHPQRGR